MDSNRKSLNSLPAGRGLPGDIQRARVNTEASLKELREFISEFRGKNPQEVLGVVAGSGLVRGTMLATAATIVGLALFTVGPFLWNKSRPAQANVAKTPAASEKASPPAATTPTTEAKAVQANAQGAQGVAVAPAAVGQPKDPLAPSGVDQKKALEKLGIGQAKSADPKANPLENSADDLLKDLK